MKNRIFLFLTLLGVTFSQAQKSHEFSLKEAVTYALEHNRNVINADLNIQAAEQQKWETTATGLPQINGKIEYQRWLKQRVSVIPAIAFDPNADPNQFNAVTFGTDQNADASITLSQLIFDGTYVVALQSAKVFLDISKNAKEKTDNQIKTATISAYNNALLTKESIEIMHKNIETLRKNLNEVSTIFENGLTEEENVEQLQLTLSNLENNLKSLKQLEIISLDVLKLLLGIESKETIMLSDNLDSLISDHISLNLVKNDNSVFDNIDIKIAENDKKAKKLLYKLEKYRQLPSLSAFLNGGYSSFSNNFDFLSGDQKWYGSSLLGINLTFPIFTSFQGKARRQRAKINLEIAENNFKNIQEQKSLEVKKLKSEYTLSIDTYYNRSKNLQLAEKIERKNNIKFKEGLASSFDLRQAQMQLYSSQQEYLQSMIDVINKKAELEEILNIKQ